jgi:hypothetical protein
LKKNEGLIKKIKTIKKSAVLNLYLDLSIHMKQTETFSWHSQFFNTVLISSKFQPLGQICCF